MTDFSLKKKLIVIFGSLIILFSIFGVYSIYSSVKFTNLTDKIYKHPLRVSNASLEVLIHIYRMKMALDELLIITDENHFMTNVHEIEDSEQEVFRDLQIITDNILGEEGKTLAAVTVKHFKSWAPHRETFIAVAKAGNLKEAKDMASVHGKVIMTELDENVLALYKYARNKADNFISESLESRTANFRNSLIFAFLILTICVTSAIIFGRNILAQLGADPNLLSKVTKRVSDGDFDIDDSDEKKTGVYKVMCTMATALKSSKQSDEERMWLRQGLVNLDSAVRGENDLKAIGDLIISHLAAYTESMVGSIYLVEENKGLGLLAGYATDPEFKISSKIKMGEGLVGAAAKSGEAVTFRDLPDNYIKISSSIGKVLPTEIHILPVFYKNDVVAAIELGKSSEFTKVELEFLSRAAEIIGITLNMAKAQTKVADLLEQTQQQEEELRVSNEELQQQQEELRVSNEELAEQTTLLKESEKRLQQQQEELRVTNEELQERSIAIEKQRDEMSRQNDLLTEVQTEVLRKAKDLEDASRYKSEFLANMSHELRTPLNSILILSQLLGEDKMGTLDQKQIDYAKTIYASGNNLLNLINDILDLSKIEAGRLDVDITDVDLKEFMQEIEAEIKPIADDKKISFSVDYAENIPEVIKTDQFKLVQVIKNLLSNSVKFTEKGEVVLSAKLSEEDIDIKGYKYMPGEILLFSVSDTGVGIPNDKLQHIFEAFRQVDGTTSRKYGGTGLGLTICKKVCELLGGDISVESKLHEGTTFTVMLPLNTEVAVAGEINTETLEEEEKVIESSSVTEPAKTYAKDESLIGKNVLLIIEDDSNFVKVLSEIAVKKGFVPAIASDGEEGLFFADYYKPKAIILDISLPGIDGFEVMRRLKENSETKSIPVHFISGSDNTMKAMQMGAIGFLKKPVTTSTLDDAFQKIESVIQKAVKNLLVVEDNDIQRQSIVELIGNGDVITTAVATAEEAYNLLLKNEFDCMILDLGLEDMDGLQFLNRIKSNKDIADMPVIIYTGQDLTHKEEKVLQKYAGSIVIKGAKSPERLLAETSLFLHRIEKNLPDFQKKILNVNSDESVLKGKEILIVDDDIRNVFALSSVLEEQGIKVLMAQDGKEGVEKALANETIDLVLMDIMMPVMDGYEAIREIRKDERGSKLPIIALTAKAMHTDRDKCIEAGANEYMAKPINVEKLLSLLRVWLYK